MRTWAALPLLCLLSLPGKSEAQSPIGTWELLSRTDSSTAGIQPADGQLGSDPLAWITYDDKGHVAAQLMARDRRKAEASGVAGSPRDPNNSGAIGGYDAYFGTYVLDAGGGTVTHHLLAALVPGDVGRTLTRRYAFRGDTLVLSFDARRTDGSLVVRRLAWRRIAP